MTVHCEHEYRSGDICINKPFKGRNSRSKGRVILLCKVHCENYFEKDLMSLDEATIQKVLEA